MAGEVLSLQAGQVEVEGLRADATLGAAISVGDPHLAQRLVANLIDNALRYNVAGGWIDVATWTRNGSFSRSSEAALTARPGRTEPASASTSKSPREH